MNMNKREKVLANAVLVFSLIFIFTWAKRKMNVEMHFMESRLRETEERSRQSRELLSAVPAKPVNEAAKKLTEILLADLRLPMESQQIRIISVDRAGTSGYQIISEGEFSEIMRFLSYLERADGKFVVVKAEISKLDSTNEAVPPREVRGSFQLDARS